jgi:hypothetical protein
MTSYFDKKKKQKLYRQWVEKSGLPPENIPAEIEGKSDLYEPVDGSIGERQPGIQRGLTFHLTMRHLLYLVLITVVLLISTATLATILIMRSC